MAEIAQMAQCHPIHFQNINDVLAQFVPLVRIVKSGNASNKDAFQFVLTGALNLFEFAGDSFAIGVPRMQMAQGHYVSLQLTQGITQTWVARVSDNNGILSLNAKARMA
jgi:hypothetical protein